jgi:hypothetical protein
MVFTGEKKKKPADTPAEEKSEEAKSEGSGDSGGGDASSSEPKSEEPAAEEPSEPSNAADAPPAIEEKPGGGCRVGHGREQGGASALLLAALALAAFSARRRAA